MMLKSYYASLVLAFKVFFTISLKELLSSFVSDVVSVAWLSFIFLDFNLTECSEFTIVTFLNY